MTAEAGASDTEKRFNKQLCESCGESFSCGASVGKCWCFAVEVPADELTELSENFQACLCRNCLEAIAGGKR